MSDKIPDSSCNGLYIDCYTKTRDFFENKRQNNKSVKNYHYCAVRLRSNFGWDEATQKGWKKLRGSGCEGGICWCASGASILTYHGKAYTTKELYTALYDKYLYFQPRMNYRPYPFNQYGDLKKPSGCTEWTTYMFNAFGNIAYNCSFNKMSYDMIQKNLKAWKPIYLVVYKEGLFQQVRPNVFNEISRGYCHAVVLCGSYEYSSKTYYVYMDPNNEDGYTVNSIPKSMRDNTNTKTFYFIPDNFSYCDNAKTGGYFYNEWYYTYSFYK